MMWWRKGRFAGWGAKALIFILIAALTPACQTSAAQIYIPLAYGLTGLCIALLVSPTPTAALVGLLVGGLLGAAVYNNSLKRQLVERHRLAAPGE
jgi:membrane-associated phospholipid phosphatase